jgi:hypothetical protein
MTNFAEELAAVEDEPEPATNGKSDPGTKNEVKLVPFRDLLAPDLMTKGLIKGLIDMDALAMVFGEPGCGKTFFAIDLALSVAEGRPFFGLKTKKARVVYIAAEAGKAIRNRVAAWATERWDEESDVDFQAIVTPVNLCDGKYRDARRIVEVVGDDNADLVIIDTVSRAMAGGDENSPEDMGTFITRSTGCERGWAAPSSRSTIPGKTPAEGRGDGRACAVPSTPRSRSSDRTTASSPRPPQSSVTCLAGRSWRFACCRSISAPTRTATWSGPAWLSRPTTYPRPRSSAARPSRRSMHLTSSFAMAAPRCRRMRSG